MSDQNEALRDAVLKSAKRFISQGKDLFAGVYTNAAGDPQLSFCRLNNDKIQADYSIGFTMYLFTFDENEIYQ